MNPSPLATQFHRFRIPLFFLLGLIVTLLQFSDGNLTKRQFINYDDLDLVKPMIDQGLGSYFTNWLPNRNHHAYPVRDLTYFFDHWVGSLTGFPVYWFTQLLLFLLVVGAVYNLGKWLWPSRPWLAFILSSIFALHPINLEVIQWLTIRKHLMVMLFLLPATVYVLNRQKKLFTAADWGFSFLMYVLALLCFPTGLLWFPWVLWFKRAELFTNKFKLGFLAMLSLTTIIFYLHWTTAGEADYAQNAGSLFAGQNLDRTGFYALVSLGRGFWNIVLPFWLAAFYRESNPLNWIGLTALVGVLVYAYQRRQKIKQLPQIKTLLLLSAVILVPSSLVFLTFAEFVWADRYAFTILPFVLGILICLSVDFFPAKKTKPLIVASSIAGVFWLIAAVGITIQRVPVWRDALILMKDCANNEKSAKCVIQTLQRALHKETCAAMAPYIKSGRDIYQNNLPKYNYEFKNEMPFYEAICIALNSNLKPSQKISQLPYLFDIYNGSAEVVFSIILSNLEAGDLNSAYAAAKSYYLSGDPKPLNVTRNTIGIYQGNIEVLCQLVDTDECRRLAYIFNRANKSSPLDMGYKDWGIRVTREMWKRRQNH